MRWRGDHADPGLGSLFFAPRVRGSSGSSYTSGVRFPIKRTPVTASDTPGVPIRISNTEPSDTPRVRLVSASHAPRASHLKTLRAAESRNYFTHSPTLPASGWSPPPTLPAPGT